MNERPPDPGGRALHQGQPTAHAGAALSRAKASMILLHGRGASAEGILSLADAFAQPEIAYFAPQAAGHSWYPHSFLAPLADNEPWLSSALQVIADILRDLASDGTPPSRVVLLGFSQGGCLALEFAARNARRYGAVIGLSAGLIGPDGTSRTYSGSLQETPVFLGCSDVDPHIPLARVHESSRSLSNLGGAVEERVYPGMGHTINEDEIKHVHSLLTHQVSATPAGALLHCMRQAAIHSGAFDGPMWRATVTQEKKEKQNANDLCGWMGVEVRPMTAAFAASLGMAVPYGAISDQPEPSSPAGAAVTREAEEDWTR